MIIVNGATGTIGSETVSQMAKSGEIVIGLGRNAIKLKELSEKVPGLVTFEVDPKRLEHSMQALESKMREFATDEQLLSGYVHCAADFERFNSPLEISHTDWSSSIEANLTYNFFWNQWALKNMITQRFGSIVNLVSQSYKTGGFTPITPYVAAKGAIVSMTKNLSNWAAPHNVRVNCVSPGLVNSPMMNKNLSRQAQAMMESRIPLARFSTEAEVVAAIRFLVSACGQVSLVQMANCSCHAC